MTWKSGNKYYNYCGFKNNDIGYDSSVIRIYEKCKELSEKYNVPIGEFEVSAENDYDSNYWEVRAVREATPEEIEESKLVEKRQKGMRREQYERLKKEFEK